MIEILNKLMFKRNKDEKYMFFREEYGNLIFASKSGREKKISYAKLRHKISEMHEAYCIAFNKYGCEEGLEEKKRINHINYFKFFLDPFAIDSQNPYIVYQLYLYVLKRYNVNILEASNFNKGVEYLKFLADIYDIEQLPHKLDGKYRLFHKQKIGSFLARQFEYYFINYKGKVISFNDNKIDYQMNSKMRQLEKENLFNPGPIRFSKKKYFDELYFDGAYDMYNNVKNNSHESKFVYRSDISRF